MEHQGVPDVNEDIFGSATSVEDIIGALAKRGCADLTSSIDFTTCDYPYAGGGFCDVYRGALHDGTSVAIKSLKIYGSQLERDSQGQRLLKRAAKELYHWSKLKQHPNVLPLMGLAVFKRYVSMVSGWMENGDLPSYLNQNPDADRLRLCMDVCAGLCHVHTNGMVHGDLKGQNIMISSDGIAMIADFGNARVKDLTLKFGNTTSRGLSYRWAAPELLLRDDIPQVSMEADVYAYGMIILETFTGKVPFDDISEGRVPIVVAYEKKIPSRPSVRVSDDLWELLNSCWTQTPSERPKITSVANRLEALSAGVAGHMGDTMAVFTNIPSNFVSRTMSSLAVMTDGMSTNDHRDEESQEDGVRADSPTNMFNTDNGSGGLVNGNWEKRKLGKGNADPIPEDKPLVVNTTTPIVIASPPSTGESSNGGSATATNGASSGLASDLVPPSNARFKAVVKRVMHGLKLTAPQNLPQSIRSMSSPSMAESRHRRDSSELQLVPLHIQTYVPMLRTLRSSQMLAEHVALVKHLQFSPDGQFLATCSWDKTALIWRVGSGPSDEFVVTHKLVHTARIGGFIGQVAWSPSGDQLLTKQLRSIKMWNPKNGVCQRTIDRKRNVQSVTWMPQGSGFVSVEWRMGNTSPQAEKRAHHIDNIVGSDLVLIGTDGTEKQDYYLNRLQVWDAAVVPGEERVVAVATLIESGKGLEHAKSQNEQRILIYNLLTREIEDQVPFLQEIRDITLTETGSYALVSYEGKAPPQAWRIDMIARKQKCRLVLAHTYFTKHLVDFAGPSYFGGVNDTFVLAASKGGEIYIWERASGELLHSLRAHDQELTHIAWNHKSPGGGFMFASAAHDGMVRIWTTTASPPPPRSLAPSPEPVEAESPTPVRQDRAALQSPARV